MAVPGGKEIHGLDETRRNETGAMAAAMMVRSRLIGIAGRLIRIPVAVQRAGTFDGRNAGPFPRVNGRRRHQRRYQQAQEQKAMA